VYSCQWEILENQLDIIRILLEHLLE
jgi:hypothetical protein